MTFAIYITLVCLLNNAVSFEEYLPDWNSLDKRPLPAWYDQAKIGIFIHWGLYSVPAFRSEWFWWYWQGENQTECLDFMRRNYRPGFKYADFLGDFTASDFDPDQWADLFQKAGAKYVVLTTKHHEGFCLFPSPWSLMYNSVDAGPGIDIVGQLSSSVRNKQMKFGTYYSLYEWFNRLYLFDKSSNFTSRSYTKMYDELVYLTEKYKPEIIWADGDWEAPDSYWQSTKLLSYLYNYSPVKETVVVNDRWGSGNYCLHGDFWNCHDHYLPNTTQKHKWENAFSLDTNSWGYRSNIEPGQIKTIESVIEEVVQTVSLGGNVLINVGPDSRGVIPALTQERLLHLGQWLDINGEAIYNTTTRPDVQRGTMNEKVWFTRSIVLENTSYALAVDPGLPGVDRYKIEHQDCNGISSIHMLGCPEVDLSWDCGDQVLSVDMQELRRQICMLKLHWAFVFKIVEK